MKDGWKATILVILFSAFFAGLFLLLMSLYEKLIMR